MDDILNAGFFCDEVENPSISVYNENIEMKILI